MSNPLLQKFNTPFGTIPFEEIKIEHYQPAIEKAIESGKQDIEKIKRNTQTPDFKNTIEALERSGKQLELVSSIFFNLNGCETSDEMQKIAQEISPALSAYADDILMDAELFEKVKIAFKNTDRSTLSQEQTMLLDKTYKGFVRNGANLNDADKNTLKEINTKLSLLSLKFGENLLKDSNHFELWITDKADLAGLPEDVIEAARMAAEEKGKKEAWLFNLDYPSYLTLYDVFRKTRTEKTAVHGIWLKGFS
jgi:Zn-dependent oligopeptidase